MSLVAILIVNILINNWNLSAAAISTTFYNKSFIQICKLVCYLFLTFMLKMQPKVYISIFIGMTHVCCHINANTKSNFIKTVFLFSHFTCLDLSRFFWDVAAVKSRPVLHHCVVIFFWSSGTMECTCMLFTFENGVLLMR